jgi:hypothetical protein
MGLLSTSARDRCRIRAPARRDHATAGAAFRIVAVLFAAVIAATTAIAPRAAHVARAAPPEHRVTLFSDSVGLGAATALPKAFPADWQVTTIGTPAYMVEQLLERHVIPTLATNPSVIGEHVVIGSGYNYPYWDPARFDRSIDSMVSTLTAAGVAHVYWVTLREVKPEYVSASAWNQMLPYSWYFPTVNDHLERALDRHPNLTLVDWAAAADRTGLTYDAIHLNPTGAALYSKLIADAVFANGTRIAAGSVTRVHVTDEASTTAVAVNLTATGTLGPGYLTAYPCDGTRPDVSNLNHARNHTVAAAAIVPVGPSGDICVYNSNSTELIVDLFGSFEGDVELVGAVPTRLHDSRNVGERQRGELRVRVAEPGGGAVALNVTALEPDAPGFVTVQACGLDSVATSNLNVVPGSVTPNLVMVEPDAHGHVCIVPSTTMHLIVDRFASFAADAPIRLVRPERIVDTRSDGSVRSPGRVVRFTVGDTSLATGTLATGVMMNLTIVEAADAGFATVYPCSRGRPGASNVNVGRGQTIANFALVQPDASGEVCVYTDVAADVVVDVLGATGAGFTGVAPTRLTDTRNGISTDG